VAKRAPYMQASLRALREVPPHAWSEPVPCAKQRGHELEVPTSSDVVLSQTRSPENTRVLSRFIASSATARMPDIRLDSDASVAPSSIAPPGELHDQCSISGLSAPWLVPDRQAQRLSSSTSSRIAAYESGFIVHHHPLGGGRPVTASSSRVSRRMPPIVVVLNERLGARSK